MPATQIESLLTPVFPKKHIASMLRHFEAMTKHFQREEWEDSIAKGSKFIESALKALCVRAGQTPATGKAFKVDSIINRLTGLQAGSVDDTVRLTIPRACRFLYEICSNRGGRHDPDEIDPNAMDATVVITTCSWILAEMLRHAQHGAVDSNAEKSIVDSLVKRKYPLIEEVEGRTYFHFNDASAVDVALVALAHCYPRRLTREALLDILRRHRFSANNSRQALQGINRIVDENASGELLLSAPGLRKAEEIMNSASSGGERE
ncbi:MAG: hypothetical protein C4293_06395 [Nitrospiraceae bacterium]